MLKNQDDMLCLSAFGIQRSDKYNLFYDKKAKATGIQDSGSGAGMKNCCIYTLFMDSGFHRNNGEGMLCALSVVMAGRSVVRQI